MTSALLVDGISKRYRLSSSPPTRLSEALVVNFRRRRTREVIWALKDVSFEVTEGSTLGIIGRNGAGKSTLLKILAGVTSPSSGSARIRGRMSALLEVGTGFHPELTGRENIYLSAAILGMSRSAVVDREADIVDFAGIGSFIDVPIKRYSSGMVVRLGFSVAAHLDPDILVIDEVLAVGDAAFRQRCIERIESGHHRGQTTILVSHDLRLVSQLAPRTLWMSDGEIVEDADTGSVVDLYLDSLHARPASASMLASPDLPARLDTVELRVAGNRGGSTFESCETAELRFRIECVEEVPGLRLVSRLRKRDGTLALVTASSDGPNPLRLDRRANSLDLVYEIPGRTLAPGSYSLSVALDDAQGQIAFYQGAISFVVTDLHYGTDDGRGGAIGPVGGWRLADSSRSP